MNYERTYWLRKDGKEIFGTARQLKKYDARLSRISSFYIKKNTRLYGWEIIGVQIREYAFYKGEHLIDVGTKSELMHRHNIDSRSFNRLSYLGRQRWIENTNRKRITELPLDKEDYNTEWSNKCTSQIL